MIQGIFYARFFPEKGTKIVAQSPPGCVVPEAIVQDSGADKPPLFDFSVMQEYIIPRKAFYNRPLTVNDPDSKYAVVGLPVCIADQRYHRNEFIFNFCLVIDAADADRVPYEQVVRRLADTFAEMERQNSYLSHEDARHQRELRARSTAGDAVRDPYAGRKAGAGPGAWRPAGRRPIESLLEIVKEDLNNYGECMIPVDDANTINMKLFPYHPAPPDVKGWHVPVAKMKFADVVDPTWDLTLQKVMAHIDGVSDVRRIAYMADVPLPLTALALRHLLYYDAVLLLDMFFFGACYAPRPGVHDFVANKGGIVDECAKYVCITPLDDGDGDEHDDDDDVPRLRFEKLRIDAGRVRRSGCSSSSHGRRVSNYMLVKLMTTFCIGKTLVEWLKSHLDNGFDVLRFIDVRRFVQFGVIKGCLYRVHKYVVSKQYLAALATGQARPVDGLDPLQQYTDGRHCFDQIITEQDLTDAEIMQKLKSFPAPTHDLNIIYK